MDDTIDWRKRASAILDQEYGPTRHGADPGRDFTVTFRTAPHAMQVSVLSEALADAYELGRNAADDRAREALRADKDEPPSCERCNGSGVLGPHLETCPECRGQGRNGDG